MIPAWQTQALADLEAAYPGGGWGVLSWCPSDIGGSVGGLSVRVDRARVDPGWFRAEVDHVEAMDPRDAARAVRTALRRLAARPVVGRAVVTGGARG